MGGANDLGVPVTLWGITLTRPKTPNYPLNQLDNTCNNPKLHRIPSHFSSITPDCTAGRGHASPGLRQPKPFSYSAACSYPARRAPVGPGSLTAVEIAGVIIVTLLRLTH